MQRSHKTYSVLIIFNWTKYIWDSAEESTGRTLIFKSFWKVKEKCRIFRQQLIHDSRLLNKQNSKNLSWQGNSLITNLFIMTELNFNMCIKSIFLWFCIACLLTMLTWLPMRLSQKCIAVKLFVVYTLEL